VIIGVYHLSINGRLKEKLKMWIPWGRTSPYVIKVAMKLLFAALEERAWIISSLIWYAYKELFTGKAS
jgi:hypothetical protein